MQVTPLGHDFVAEVTGIDLRHPLSPAEAAAVEAAADRYAVLVFPGQDIDDAQQVAFAENFGVVEPDHAVVDADKRRIDHTKVNDISNLDEGGKLFTGDDRRRLFSLGNRLWHSDSSFKRVPSKYSMLHSRSIPPTGGTTEFADMRAAWDALPEEEKAVLLSLVAEHSLIFSRDLLGFDNYTPEERAKWAPVPQRLVRRHAGSGRLSLFLSAHIGRIQGMPVPEARALLRELTEHATQRDFVHAHRWRLHDLVLWDNRCSMHRARPFDDQRYPRDMRRVTLMDSGPTLEQRI